MAQGRNERSAAASVAKNALIFVPLMLAHSLKVRAVAQVIVAFACFSLCASASYIVNDLLDIEADRLHPKKRGSAVRRGETCRQALVWASRCFCWRRLSPGRIFLMPHFCVGC